MSKMKLWRPPVPAVIEVWTQASLWMSVWVPRPPEWLILRCRLSNYAFILFDLSVSGCSSRGDAARFTLLRKKSRKNPDQHRYLLVNQLLTQQLNMTRVRRSGIGVSCFDLSSRHSYAVSVSINSSSYFTEFYSFVLDSLPKFRAGGKKLLLCSRKGFCKICLRLYKVSHRPPSGAVMRAPCHKIHRCLLKVDVGTNASLLMV